MITATYNKETGEFKKFDEAAPDTQVFRIEEKAAEPTAANETERGIPTETIKELLQQAQANLDGGFIWQYINENTNIKELLKMDGDKVVSVSMAAFFAGMKFALENIDISEE